MNLGNPPRGAQRGDTVTHSQLFSHPPPPRCPASILPAPSTQMPTARSPTATTNQRTKINACSGSLRAWRGGRGGRGKGEEKKRKKRGGKLFSISVATVIRGREHLIPGVNANQPGVLLFSQDRELFPSKFIRTSSTASLKNLLCHPLPKS